MTFGINAESIALSNFNDFAIDVKLTLTVNYDVEALRYAEAPIVRYRTFVKCYEWMTYGRSILWVGNQGENCWRKY